MRTTSADDASSSCNVDSRCNETVETVGVNNCVINNNVNSNTIINNKNNEAIASDITSDIDCMQLVDYLAVELLDDVNTTMMSYNAGNNDDDNIIAYNDDGGGDGGPKKTVKNNLIINVDDDMQSNYLERNESNDIIKPSSCNNLNILSSTTSSTTSYSASKTPTSALSQNTKVLPKGTYTVTRDNNKNHRNAVRRNFSLWIGVTSCVWGLLVLLLKNYSD